MVNDGPSRATRKFCSLMDNGEYDVARRGYDRFDDIIAEEICNNDWYPKGTITRYINMMDDHWYICARNVFVYETNAHLRKRTEAMKKEMLEGPCGELVFHLLDSEGLF